MQFGKSPQSPPSRTRCPSPKPSVSAAVRDCFRHRRRDSPWRVWTAALPPGRGRLRMSPRPRASEVRGPTFGTPAASQAARNRASPGASPDPQPPVAGEAATGGGPCRGKAGTSGELLPGQRVCKMAAPMELFCWSGGWGLPSVDLDSLAVLVRDGAGVLCYALETRGGGPNSARSANTSVLRETEAIKGRYGLSDYAMIS